MKHEGQEPDGASGEAGRDEGARPQSLLDFLQGSPLAEVMRTGEFDLTREEDPDGKHVQ